MAFIHRFACVPSEQVHFDVVVIDGVVEPKPGQAGRFIAAQATDAA